jgi:hypothetical protein
MTLRLWDPRAGQLLYTFAGTSAIQTCDIAPDGSWVIAGESSGRVHFLQLVEADPTNPAIGETKIQLLRREEPATD